jgi:hypothetical protein
MAAHISSPECAEAAAVAQTIQLPTPVAVELEGHMAEHVPSRFYGIYWVATPHSKQGVSLVCLQ